MKICRMSSPAILSIVFSLGFVVPSSPAMAQAPKESIAIETYPVGHPANLAFDGTNIWATNAQDDYVTKLRASDGTILDTFDVGRGPSGITFDGTNIWVANVLDDSLTKL